MEANQLKIDVASVARDALTDCQPGEDLNEAILRTCKKLYGETGVTAFQAVQSAVTALAQRDNGDREKALRSIAEAKASVTVVANIHVSHNSAAKSLDDLSSGMRAEVEKAFALGKSGKIVFRAAINKHNAASESVDGQMSRCAKCGYDFPRGLPSCPQCGTEKKHSFWSRLFGR